MNQGRNALQNTVPARVLWAMAVFGLSLAVAGADGGAALAQETIRFLGTDITPQAVDYVVLKDVSVRALPKTGARRAGSFREGERIHGVGRAPGAWIAVSKDGKPLGFVYSKMLMPVIDGSLAKPLKGQLAIGPSRCGYVISYLGRSEVEGAAVVTADYDLDLSCKRQGRAMSFPAFMFMTETPYHQQSAGVYQISVDVRELGEAFENTVSVIFLYNRDKALLQFDSVTETDFSAPPNPPQRPVASLADALRGALEMALNSWNEKTWKALGRGQP